MEIISNIALISINETLIVQLGSFLLFLFIINKIMFKPLRKSMAERESYIEKMQIDIETSQKKIETLLVKLKQKEADVRKEAFYINVELQEGSNNKVYDILEKTMQKIEEKKKESKKEIAAKMDEAKKYLKNESQKVALLIIDKVLDRKLI
jgi:F-type H+-transporting ATPase subunit b